MNESEHARGSDLGYEAALPMGDLRLKEDVRGQYKQVSEHGGSRTTLQVQSDSIFSSLSPRDALFGTSSD